MAAEDHKPFLFLARVALQHPLYRRLQVVITESLRDAAKEGEGRHVPGEESFLRLGVTLHAIMYQGFTPMMYQEFTAIMYHPFTPMMYQ